MLIINRTYTQVTEKRTAYSYGEASYALASPLLPKGEANAKGEGHKVHVREASRWRSLSERREGIRV